MLYNYVVNPAASHPNEETSGVFPLAERAFPSAFLELMTAGIHTYPSALIDTILRLTTIFATLLGLSSVNEAIRVRTKNSNRTTMRGCCMRSFLFLPLLHHCALLLLCSGFFFPFPLCQTSQKPTLLQLRLLASYVYACDL